MTTINDDRVLDAQDMAEEMEQARNGSEINGETLRTAARAYAQQFAREYEFPVSLEHFEIVLQLAFNEGALWYNQKKLAESEVKLKEAEDNLRKVLHGQ